MGQNLGMVEERDWGEMCKIGTKNAQDLPVLSSKADIPREVSPETKTARPKSDKSYTSQLPFIHSQKLLNSTQISSQGKGDCRYADRKKEPF